MGEETQWRISTRLAYGNSQEKPADNMELVLEKIRADKKLLVAENLQLTEAEAKALWPVYGRYQDELFLLRTRTAKLITDYAEAYEQMSNDTAKKLLDEYMTIEALGLKLRQAYLPKFPGRAAGGQGGALLSDREQDLRGAAI